MRLVVQCMHHGSAFLGPKQFLLQLEYVNTAAMQGTALAAVEYKASRGYMSNQPYTRRLDKRLRARCQRLRAAVGHVVRVVMREGRGAGSLGGQGLGPCTTGPAAQLNQNGRGNSA